MALDTNVVVAVVAAAAAITTTALQLRQGRQVNEVHGQVKNAHSTNLRQDIDGIQSLLKQLMGQTAGLQRALAKEQTARVALEKKLTAFMRKR